MLDQNQSPFQTAANPDKNRPNPSFGSSIPMTVKVPQKTVQSEADLVLDISADKRFNDGPKTEEIKIMDAINEWVIQHTSKIKLEEKLLFFQLLGSMISAGLPIIDALNLLKDQTKNELLKKVIDDLRNQIEDGKSLAIALRGSPDVFDEATCSVIEAGEKSGKLNSIMKELVAQYEQVYTLTKKIKAVMVYPVVVLVVMALLTIIVLVFVVPKLEELFGGAENLPLATRILINASNIMMTQGHWILLAFAAVVYGFKKWKSSPTGKKIWSNFVLVAPVSGDMLRKMILVRVSRIFGFLIGAGVPVVESLKIASAIAENPTYQDKLLLAADDLTKGISIAENLSDDEKLFPRMMVNMMAIGEKTASLDTVMGKAADFYQEELERKIGGLSKIMEPIILGVIAFGAVFMILAIYLPILKMNDQIMA